MNKVLPGEIFILMEKVFTHINSQQMWINFNTVSSSPRAGCAIQIKFNLDAVDKRMEVVMCKRYQFK